MTRKEFLPDDSHILTGSINANDIPQPNDLWVRQDAKVGEPWIYKMNDERYWELKAMRPEGCAGTWAEALTLVLEQGF